MAIERRNIRTGSTITGILNPRKVTLPASDFRGIALAQSVSKGGTFSLNGPMMSDPQNGFAATNMLRYPTAISILTAANADKVLLDVEGLDHLGRKVRGPVWKTNASVALESGGYIVWSRIDRVTLLDASSSPLTIALGVSYNAFAISGGGLITSASLSNQGRSIRRIPIPFACRNANDFLGMEFAGWDGGAMTLITTAPETANITFSGGPPEVTATSSAAWTLTGTQAGDVAYLRNGAIGILTGTGAANAITVERFVQKSLPLTDLTDITGPAGAQSEIAIFRPVNRTIQQMGNFSSSVAVSPMIPGANAWAANQNPTSGGTLTFPDGSACPTNLDGLHLPSMTFGIQTYAASEPSLPPQWNVYLRDGAF